MCNLNTLYMRNSYVHINEILPIVIFVLTSVPICMHARIYK